LPQHSPDDGDPAFSPDGRRIVFSGGASRTGSPRHLWVSDAAGAHARELGPRGSGPAWSTRNWIAFCLQRGIYRIRPDGTGRRRLTRATGYSPTWSPDGRRLAFLAGQHVHVTAADGTHARRIGSGTIDGIAWSPDGRRLAGIGYFEGMWTMDLRGRRLRSFSGGGADSAETHYYSNGIDWQPLPR
jgi:Tol biopolymer transport system component